MNHAEILPHIASIKVKQVAHYREFPKAPGMLGKNINTHNLKYSNNSY